MGIARLVLFTFYLSLRRSERGRQSYPWQPGPQVYRIGCVMQQQGSWVLE